MNKPLFNFSQSKTPNTIQDFKTIKYHPRDSKTDRNQSHKSSAQLSETLSWNNQQIHEFRDVTNNSFPRVLNFRVHETEKQIDWCRERY